MTYVPLQARYRTDPWRVCVVCALLNMTSRIQVGPVLDRLFERWPTPQAMANANENEVAAVLKTTGMAYQKAFRIRNLSLDYMQHEYLDTDVISSIHGCGLYAADAFRLFCQGYTDMRSHDPVLREYVEEVVLGLGNS